MIHMIILVLGSNGYIGSNVIREFQKNMDVTIVRCDILEEDITHRVNLLDEKDIIRFFVYLRDTDQYPDVIINCSGYADSADQLKFKSLEEITTSSFIDMVNINLISAFIITREYIKYCPYTHQSHDRSVIH